MTAASYEEIQLESDAFRRPIALALNYWKQRAFIGINAFMAVDLEPTPDMPHMAKSVTNFTRGNKVAGKLLVVAVAGHGGFDENSRDFANPVSVVQFTDTAEQEQAVCPALTPRNMRGVAAEVYLALAVVNLAGEGVPQQFCGRLDMLGRQGQQEVLRTPPIGQTEQEFRNCINDRVNAAPRAVLTTGQVYNGTLIGERIGDSRAFYNPYEHIVQIFGLLAIAEEDIYQQVGILDALKASVPVTGSQP